MNRIRCAVILAAGIGSRLRSIHNDKPKGFLQIGDKPIIEESIARLIYNGIQSIIIVTGYKNHFYDDLKNKYPFIKTIKNDHFETTGSMFSLFTAKELVNDDFLLLESDLLYESNALQSLLHSSDKNVILLSGATGAGDEVYVGVEGKHIVNMSKKISDIKKLGGELVGISKISQELYEKMGSHIDSHQDKKTNYHYEDCLTDLAGDNEINFHLIEDLAWIEIDDEQHHKRAIEKIYPLICRRDSEIELQKRVERNILLNPGPATTTDTVKYSMVVEDICPREREFGELVEGIRKDLVRIVHGEDSHEAVLFASSGTGGVEACLTSVIPDDKAALIINNGAYGKRMVQICDGYGINYIKYDIPFGDPVELDKLEQFVNANKNILSHIAFVHHETTVGILNPVGSISEIAQKYNLEIIVDAMSSYAGIPIDVNKDKIHFLISSSNKCIQGMAGISFVICNRESLQKTSAYKRRNFYFNLFDNFTFFSKSRQMQFTPPVQIFYALRQAINEYFIETEEGRNKRYVEMYEVLKKGLLELGFKFLVDEKYHAKILTAVIEPEDKNYDFNRMHHYLYERGFTIYPGKGAKLNTFRIANMGQLYKEDIENFLLTLRDYLSSNRITLNS
jgi:2-aminoethylphosphonate-pyruvate transaminase